MSFASAVRINLRVFFLAGDFNARHVAWCHRTNKAGRYLRDCLSSWGATTLNPPQIPTCTRSNGQSTIDLTLTNQPEWASAAVVGGLPPPQKDIASTGITRIGNPSAHTSMPLQIGARLDLEDLVVDFNNVVMDAARRYIPTKEMKDFSSQAPYWWEQAHAALLQEKELADKDMREALPGRLRRAAKFRLLRINRKVRKNEQLLRTNSWRNFCNSFEDASQLYALFKRSKGKWLKASTCRVQL
mmetsp:Transcript_1423/g.2509  ORF Transcript_1423/g.2509 Transcript_1423/m.2509 type:complete len:243 (-) Transcript_1423:2350-3078(-)